MANTYFSSQVFTATVRNQFDRILPQLLGTGRLSSKLATQWTSIQSFEAAVLAEMQHATGGEINLGLFTARIVDADGDVAAIAVASGNGGQLASDTAPILEANGTTNAQQLRWIANGVERICFDPVSLPADFDRTAACYVDLYCTAAGATNAPTFTVISNWDAGADVSDTATGAAQAAIQTVTATIAAADIPDTARVVNISLTPSAHATDAWQLHGARIRYARKLLTTWS